MNDIREDRSKWISRLEIDSRFPMDTIIDKFDGTDNTFLSNFYPFEIRYGGEDFQTTEHAYQYMKAVKGSKAEDGQLWTDKIRLASTPAKTKKYGRQCPLVPDWEEIKLGIMKGVLIQKFKDTPLWEKLDATGNAYLIEGNTWHDNQFGICVKKNCERGCWKKKGQNKLGLFLMQLRAIERGEYGFVQEYLSR